MNKIRTLITLAFNAALALGIVFMALPVLCIAILHFLDWLKVREFDSEDWVAGSDMERAYMADDLVEDWIVGRNRTEIIALIGEPRPCWWCEPGEEHWWIGLERGPIRWDDHCVVVRFGPNGVASWAGILDC